MRRSFYRDFTLIEMLVVIAIISILMAMLSPALVKARQSAQAIYCVNNIKMINLGFVQYSVDFNNFLPPGRGDAISDFLFPIKIRNYLGIPGSTYGTNVTRDEVIPKRNSSACVFLCPAVAQDQGGIPRISYAPTTCANSSATAVSRYGGFYVYNTGSGIADSGRTIPKKNTRIPPKSVLLIEKKIDPAGNIKDFNFAPWQTNSSQRDYASYGRHPGFNGNFLSFDGRVFSLPTCPKAGVLPQFNWNTWEFTGRYFAD